MANQQFAVIGLGRFGTTIARELYEAGAEVAAVDESEDVVEAIKNHVTTALAMNATSAEALATLAIASFDAVIVAMGKDVEGSILVTALLRQQGARQILARASSELHAQILRLVGADEVVYPEHDAAMRVASKLLSPTLIDRVELGGDLELAVLTVPNCFVGHSLRQLRLRNRYGVIVLAAHQAGQDSDIHAPEADYVFAQDDRIYIVGTEDRIQSLCQLG